MDEARRREIDEEELYRAKARARARKKRRSKPRGFSTLERAVAAYGVVHDPITTSLLAANLLHTETNPERRAELEEVRSRVNTRFVIALVFVVIFVLVAMVLFQRPQAHFDTAVASHVSGSKQTNQQRMDDMTRAAQQNAAPVIVSPARNPF